MSQKSVQLHFLQPQFHDYRSVFAVLGVHIPLTKWYIEHRHTDNNPQLQMDLMELAFFETAIRFNNIHIGGSPTTTDKRALDG